MSRSSDWVGRDRVESLEVFCSLRRPFIYTATVGGALRLLTYFLKRVLAMMVLIAVAGMREMNLGISL